MKVAWLTPLSRGSAIARYSLVVVRAMSASAEVTLWFPESTDDLPCPSVDSHPLPLGAPDVDRFAEYDVVVYNMGNNADFHATLYEWYRRVPGLVVLHDKVMQDFFRVYSVGVLKDPAFYVDLMTYLYGQRGRRAAIVGLAVGWSHDRRSRYAREFPLFEPLLWNARGAVVHSAEAARLVSERYGKLLPVTSVELPYFDYGAEYAGRELATAKILGLPDDRVVVVASGRIGPSKRLDVLLRAFSADPAVRDAAYLVVAGSAETRYLDGLRRLVRGLGLEGSTRFVLSPDDWTMHSYVAAADVCVNLRNPSTESASAALVEQIHFGKPTIVTDIGFYSELPDEMVLKTSPAQEVEGVGAALRRLITDVDKRTRMGRAVRAYAVHHHSPEGYAEALLALISDLPDRTRALATVDRAAENLRAVQPRFVRDVASRMAARLSGELSLG